jgi:acetyltransferase-like isoleucine patch superfamily enzyme
MRSLLKATAGALATLLVLPALCSYVARSWIFGRDHALEGSTQALSLIPGQLGQYLRRAFLERTLAYCAPSAVIEFGTIFAAAGTRIEEGSYIGPRCHIGLAHIERDVLIAAAVHIPSGGRIHGISDLTVPIRDQPGVRTVVRIGAGSWIGSAAVVMADVGRGTVVAAGAVVTKALPDLVIAGGVPARVLRSRDNSQVLAPASASS